MYIAIQLLNIVILSHQAQIYWKGSWSVMHGDVGVWESATKYTVSKENIQEVKVSTNLSIWEETTEECVQ